jgi:hypothetical protein
MQMSPIVDGLENQYHDQIIFIRLDANSEDGGETFRNYGLRGHPSYVLLNFDGNVLWKGVGEKTAAALEVEIQKHITPSD